MQKLQPKLHHRSTMLSCEVHPRAQARVCEPPTASLEPEPEEPAAAAGGAAHGVACAFKGAAALLASTERELAARPQKVGQRTTITFTNSLSITSERDANVALFMVDEVPLKGPERYPMLISDSWNGCELCEITRHFAVNVPHDRSSTKNGGRRRSWEVHQKGLALGGAAHQSRRRCIFTFLCWEHSVHCVPNTFQPSRYPSTGCHSTGAGGACQY